jgi:hypothetical protein
MMVLTAASSGLSPEDHDLEVVVASEDVEKLKGIAAEFLAERAAEQRVEDEVPELVWQKFDARPPQTFEDFWRSNEVGIYHTDFTFWISELEVV